VVEEYLKPLAGINIDTLVLGCTHYPLLKPVIGSLLGKDVTLVDSAVEISREVGVVLNQQKLASKGPGGHFDIILSDTSPTFAEIASRFLGRRAPEIELVSVR
jgi:glutamate racemase